MEIVSEAETSKQLFASALSTFALTPIPVTLPIPHPGQVASVQQQLPSGFISKALPATSVKLQSILSDETPAHHVLRGVYMCKQLKLPPLLQQ